MGCLGVAGWFWKMFFFFFSDFGSFCFFLMSFDCINHIDHIHLSHIIYMDQKIPEQCEKGTASWRSLKAEGFFSILDVALDSKNPRNNESFEPYTQNLYVRRVLSGEFVQAPRPNLDFFTPVGSHLLWRKKPPFVTGKMKRTQVNRHLLKDAGPDEPPSFLLGDVI